MWVTILQWRQAVYCRAGAAKHQLLLSQPVLIAEDCQPEGVIFYLFKYLQAHQCQDGMYLLSRTSGSCQ